MAAQCSDLAPVLRLQQRLGPSPDVRVIGNDHTEIRLAGRNGRARRNRQQIDLCARVCAFQRMRKRQREHEITNQVEADDQDTLRLEARWPQRLSPLSYTTQLEEDAQHAQQQIDTRAQHTLAAPHRSVAEPSARIRSPWIAILIEGRLYFCHSLSLKCRHNSLPPAL